MSVQERVAVRRMRSMSGRAIAASRYSVRYLTSSRLGAVRKPKSMSCRCSSYSGMALGSSVFAAATKRRSYVGTQLRRGRRAHREQEPEQMRRALVEDVRRFGPGLGGIADDRPDHPDVVVRRARRAHRAPRTPASPSARRTGRCRGGRTRRPASRDRTAGSPAPAATSTPGPSRPAAPPAAGRRSPRRRPAPAPPVLFPARYPPSTATAITGITQASILSPAGAIGWSSSWRDVACRRGRERSARRHAAELGHPVELIVRAHLAQHLERPLAPRPRRLSRWRSRRARSRSRRVRPPCRTYARQTERRTPPKSTTPIGSPPSSSHLDDLAGYAETHGTVLRSRGRTCRS